MEEIIRLNEHIFRSSESFEKPLIYNQEALGGSFEIFFSNLNILLC